MSGARGGIGAMTQLILNRDPLPAYVEPVLDADQMRVVNHRSGAMRVLAGPGTGKTTTLVAAMAGRLSGSDALKPEQVLGLTFGRRAALDWRDRVTAAVGGGVVPEIKTFHSFCYGLVREFTPEALYESELRLLSGPEQEARARELFTAAISDGRLNWPTELMPAVGTRGLSEEVRAVMSRARSHGLDPDELEFLGRTVNRETWQAIGSFMDEYLDALDSASELDYTELIHRAALLSHDPEVQKWLHTKYKAIFVDEYQDTDPGQVALLKAMVNASTSLIVVGDIDQAIYGFRGADETGIRNFADDFSSIFTSPVEDVVLQNCRRFGPVIREAASAIIREQRPAGIAKKVLDAHRTPKCHAATDGAIKLLTFDSDGAQAAHIADTLVRANSQHSFKWSDMAVIVRSASTSIPMLQRAMVAAGIPVEIAADEIPIHQDPAAIPLLQILRVVDDAKYLTADVAVSILTGPLVHVDPVDLRRFGKYLRTQDRSETRAPRPSMWLLAQALDAPESVLDVPPGQHDAVRQAVTTIGELIRGARSVLNKGGTPHEVLWHIWQGTDLPTTLERQALGYGQASLRANRDLDAIGALFDLASRFAARGRSRDLTDFLFELQSQQIPAESLAENDTRADCVRLLTAHRAKGLQWKLVVVAAVQEDMWPDLRSHQTLLQAERIGKREELMPPTVRERLAEERRLFYVAITRAMEELIITAVDTSSDSDGSVPSRFLDDIKPNPRPGETLAPTPGIERTHVSGRPARPLSVDGVIAGLRRTLGNPQASDGLKRAAAQALAELIKRQPNVFSHAHPDAWWGAREITRNERGPAQPLYLSPSSIRNLEKCSMRWFLEHEVKAQKESGTPALFGTALHAIAQGLQTGQVQSNIEDINSHLDKLWPAMGFEAQWHADGERAQAEEVSERLLNWMDEHGQTEGIAESKLVYETILAVPQTDGTIREVQVKLNGRADRIEFTADGVVIYDFKTQNKKVEPKDLPTDIQLAMYAMLMQSGQYEEADTVKQLSPDQVVKGAALVMLRIQRKGDEPFPLEQYVTADEHDANSLVPLRERIGTSALNILDERFEARDDNENHCNSCSVRLMCPAKPEGRQVL